MMVILYPKGLRQGISKVGRNVADAFAFFMLFTLGAAASPTRLGPQVLPRPRNFLLSVAHTEDPGPHTHPQLREIQTNMARTCNSA